MKTTARSTCRSSLALLAVSCLTALYAQNAPRPSFEVASLQPSPPGTRGVAGDETPGRIRIANVTVENLIHLAFERMPQEVLGIPGWATADRYTLTAKLPEDSSTHDKMQMLLGLLEERFQLRWHSELRQMSAYALVVAKGGPKLTASQKKDASETGMRLDTRGASMNLSHINMSFLASSLANSLQSRVVDKTGLTGFYDLLLQFRPPGWIDAPPDPEFPSIFAALEDFGLQLQETKSPIEVIVVDSIERKPLEN